MQQNISECLILVLLLTTMTLQISAIQLAFWNSCSTPAKNTCSYSILSRNKSHLYWFLIPICCLISLTAIAHFLQQLSFFESSLQPISPQVCCLCLSADKINTRCDPPLVAGLASSSRANVSTEESKRIYICRHY